MLIFKGKAKNLNISKELEKNFGVYFHPKCTLDQIHKIGDVYATKHHKISKPKSTILQVDRKGEHFEE